jgi:DNA-binding GntR family transcriptional regulator
MNRISEPKVQGDRGGLFQIRRQPLPDEVAKRLRQLILEGKLKPGTRIQEKTLSEQLGVSRTPLREAFKVLATEGLIELLPHRGAVIAILTPEDLDHMFTVLGALEGLAGELACLNISEEALNEVRALHDRMFKCYRERKRTEYFRINQLIHEKIIAAADNLILFSVYASLSGRIRRARYTPDISEAAWAQGAKDHEMILDALTARDADRLNRILKDHLRHKRDGVKAALAPQLKENRPRSSPGQAPAARAS